MTIEAFAKVNLTLEVLGKRADGYHALRSLVVPVSLADTLDIAATQDGVLTGDSPYPDDLCLKAAHALREEAIACLGASARIHAATIHIVKRIPAGGGLGGGSADAAATLRALNELWRLEFPREVLVRVAAKVGSDVPALVLGGAVVMEGRGEIVTPFGPLPRLDMVLVNPGVFSSTKAVYAACSPKADSGETRGTKIWYNMRSRFARAELEDFAGALMNDLEEPAVRLHPEIGEVLAALRADGAAGVLMSGSGSTVFGLVPSEARGLELAAHMRQKGWQAWFAHTVCPVM